MNIPPGNSVSTRKRLSDRDWTRLRNAMSRRKLQNLHEEKVLQSWLAEVWDQPANGRVATGDWYVPARQ